MTAAAPSIRRWPYLTATVVGIPVWFATGAILHAMAPGAYAWIGLIGFGVGVIAGTLVSGLKGAAGWTVSPVITLCVWFVVFGTLAFLGVRFPF